ncbi:translation initiation factor 2 [Pseudomonas sp. HR96]|uniref:translation initiation factor 2 n=1 Tax=Pseudomonas sp. HR96 TaxID=1027966 RepID=UPI002A762F56|nr:translation initiation factor 2 [Pseudomonas sp. HR96]WPO98610.1 translation initiation factor 2 [Pseudomonas sp. HR96]
MTALRCVVVLLLGLATPFASVSAATPATDAAPAAKSTPAKSAAAKPAAHKTPAAKSKKATAASKTKARKEADAIAAPVPEAKLDLSLPTDVVKNLQAPGQKAAKPIHDGYLPQLFPDKKSEDSFQLNGRLLSNEMQLQLRNEEARKVEGAALDFEFKQ